jgi:hypothetical protein
MPQEAHTGYGGVVAQGIRKDQDNIVTHNKKSPFLIFKNQGCQQAIDEIFILLQRKTEDMRFVSPIIKVYVKILQVLLVSKLYGVVWFKRSVG